MICLCMYRMVRNSFSPTSKPQTVVPVASRSSMDSLLQRSTQLDVVPDMEGWLHKQGDKYKTWNRRWFVLKGPNLFYFKSPKVRVNCDGVMIESVFMDLYRM